MKQQTFKKDQKLSERQAEALARKIITCGGSVIFPEHAENRMESRGFEKSDVYYILETGKVIDIEAGPNNDWRYKFSGKDLEDVDGKVIITFVTFSSGVIITVF